MALIIEDGTGVANATSYVSVSDARAWALLRGLTFTGADSVVEYRLVNAMDLLESYRDKWRGTKTDSTQALQWPRKDVVIDGEDFDEDLIPPMLISAQIQFAYDSQSYPLQPLGSGREKIKEKVDVIEITYNPKGTGTNKAQFNKALDFLKPLMKSGFNSWSIETIRA